MLEASIIKREIKVMEECKLIYKMKTRRRKKEALVRTEPGG